MTAKSEHCIIYYENSLSEYDNMVILKIVDCDKCSVGSGTDIEDIWIV